MQSKNEIIPTAVQVMRDGKTRSTNSILLKMKEEVKLSKRIGIDSTGMGVRLRRSGMFDSELIRIKGRKMRLWTLKEEYLEGNVNGK